MAGGRFTLLEHPPASERLHTQSGPLQIRFQIQEVHASDMWAPILGFTLQDETGDLEIDVDFAVLPGFEQLVLAADRKTRSTKTVENLAKVQVPRFKKHDVHEFELQLAPSSVIVVIDGKRRPLKRDFEVRRLVVRPSGVKGWVEFPQPASA